MSLNINASKSELTRLEKAELVNQLAIGLKSRSAGFDDLDEKCPVVKLQNGLELQYVKHVVPLYLQNTENPRGFYDCLCQVRRYDKPVNAYGQISTKCFLGMGVFLDSDTLETVDTLASYDFIIENLSEKQVEELKLSRALRLGMLEMHPER
jgi:hypothetical protein